ncbi:MAG TPA: ABC transporter permease [Kofleriaceae bacterium]|nr:ABC transporter permease [Kofleriaceae bacterium]
MTEPAPDGAPTDPEGAPSVGRAIGAGLHDVVAPAIRFVDRVGDHVILAARALAWLPRRPQRLGNYLDALEYIGVGSLGIVLLVGLFTGAVISLQAVFAFKPFHLESYAGGTSGKALAVELAPVLTALMLAGRAGSGIATELGTMRITEQIDALESMAVNPIQFLVLPRLVAGMIMGPVLTLLFFVVSMLGAYGIAVIGQGVDQGQFILHVRELVFVRDVMQGEIKSVVFGLLITLIGCYQGYNASGGGRGVGLGTTRAVVISSVMILVSDYLMANVLLRVMNGGST